MNNLISNAMKFTSENGSVTVKISLDKIDNDTANIHFSVKDTGIGIAKEKLPTIFKAFSQADNSISREFGGTGLGLAISNRYINMMGSNIKVNSELNKGSEFYFNIDLPILNHKKAIEKTTSTSNLTIDILYSQEEGICAINENISTYLKEWNCNYREIYNLDEVNNSVNILIICAKLFDQEKCEKVLEEYESLQLIYIEGIEDNFSCSHPRFHLVEQPMTGSAIFDKLVLFSTTQSNCDISNKKEYEIKDSSYDGYVLVTEDNKTNQMLISIMLEERGVKYDIANHGQEALDMIEKDDKYDLILMDINMPVLDGVSTIKILRKNNYTKPIVSLSANVIEKDKESFLAAGVDDTLNKPVVPEELDRILTNYIKTKPEKEDITVDIIKVEDVCKNLSINNEAIVLKLLNSFKNSASEILKTLQDNYIDKHLAHTIKGISGNLRLKNLYQFVINFEEDVDLWSDEEHEKNRKILIYHLEDLIQQIEKLNN
jgi:CheY-like chemotaxis protein